MLAIPSEVCHGPVNDPRCRPTGQLLLLCSLSTAASPIPRSVKPKSNPSAAKAQKRDGNAADLAFQQSAFGRDLVHKVKKGAVYIWSMTPDASGLVIPSSIGSGFIFQALPEENAAYALTNHHVSNDNTLMQVETWDHTTYKAEPILNEPGIDVALIKILNIPPGSYEVNVLGDSDSVLIGEPALAIGAPGTWDSKNVDRSDPDISYGLHQTATMRVVTGKETNAIDFATWRVYGNMSGLGNQMCTNLPWRFVVQSAINGGNWWPLYNARGEVIGLNHAHSVPVRRTEFTYRQLCEELRLPSSTRDATRPWFGMDVLLPRNGKTKKISVGKRSLPRRPVEATACAKTARRSGGPAARA